MNNLKNKILTGLAALVAISEPVPAHADFYDGVRGPSKAQVHYTLSAQKTTSHTLAGKYFGDSVFVVGAATVDGKSLWSGFAGVGYIEEHSERIKAIPLIGYSTSGDGKKGTLTAILQATVFLDKNGTFLADPRYVLSVPIYGYGNHTPTQAFGLTLSAGNERVRVGPDLNYTLGNEKVMGGVLIRYDIDAKHHSSWIELGLSPNGDTQFQFRGNF